MAWIVPTTSTNSPLSIGTIDSIHITELISIGGIYASGSNQQIIIDGKVEYNYGILLGNKFGDHETVTISSTGIVNAVTGVGIDIYSDNSIVDNNGHVYGKLYGIELRSEFSLGTTTLTNSGTIEGNLIGIGRYTYSKDTISLTNTGTITGGSYSYGQIGGDANAVDILVNRGTMNGAVDTGGGADVMSVYSGQINGAIYLGTGNDTVHVYGGLINGNVFLGDGDDNLQLSKGGRIYGAIDGGAGNDTIIVGNTYPNHILGGIGDDTITGGIGKDTLSGGDGNDLIKGRAGDDTIMGRAGRDRLYGGTGADTFAFLSTSESGLGSSRDVIHDFNSAEGDKIDLRAIDADTIAAGNQVFSFIGTGSFTHHARELRAKAYGTDLIVFGDVNGDGVADFSIQIKNLASLTAGAFFL